MFIAREIENNFIEPKLTEHEALGGKIAVIL
jgi:hypothetical protein